MQINIRKNGDILFLGNGVTEIIIDTSHIHDEELTLLITAAIKQLSTQN